MMDRKKAAEYFVVAWVKGWTLGMYLKVLADGGASIRYEDAHTLYPWLPDKWQFVNHGYCRTHLAGTNRPLSDALWDAKDNRARLALAPQIAAFVAGRQFDYLARARTAVGWSARKLQRAKLSKDAWSERYSLMSGADWTVCK